MAKIKSQKPGSLERAVIRRGGGSAYGLRFTNYPWPIAHEEHASYKAAEQIRRELIETGYKEDELEVVKMTWTTVRHARQRDI